MSHYFTYEPIAQFGRALSSGVNARFTGVQAAFDLLPPPDLIRQGRPTYAPATGTSNALVVALPITATAYVEGLRITTRAASNNTGPATINVDNLGVKQIVRADGTALEAGDILAGQILDLTYDGTQFRLSLAFVNMSAAGIKAKIAEAGDIAIKGLLTVSVEERAVRFTNEGPLGAGAGASNARNHFTQYNAGTAAIATGWIAAAFGRADGNRVVIGQYDGKAVIGAENGNLSGGVDLVLRRDGDRVTVTAGGVVVEGSVACQTPGTTASAANLFHGGGATSQILRSTSSLKYKTDVLDLANDEADKLFGLRPITYRSKAWADDGMKRHWGFIAEEAEAADLGRLVHYGEDGTPDGFQYERVVVGLLNIVKRQEARIAALEARLA